MGVLTLFSRSTNTSSVQKQKQKKMNIIKCLAHTKWGVDQGNLFTIHKMIILSTLRYGQEAYGSAFKAMLKKLEPTHNRRIRLALEMCAVCYFENALCGAGVSTLADMRNLNTAITAIRFISFPNHPIRPYCLYPTKLEEYALRPAASKPLFVRAMEYFGKLHQKDKTYGRTSTISDSTTNYAQSDEAQATKSTNITAKYTQTDRKMKKRLETQ
jgi:hypothetical protein